MILHQQIKVLQNIVSRKGSSKILTFSTPHVFKALQMLMHQRFVSRAEFCKSLFLGEGAIKTLILHLKKAGLVDSTRSGTFLTSKGTSFIKKLTDVIPAECVIMENNMFKEKYNHVILLRNYTDVIKSGMEQRDYAILYGATEVITLIFTNGKFVFPNEGKEFFAKETELKKNLIEKLSPCNNDVIIITMANEEFIAEISAKNSALWTVAQHENH